LFVETPDVGDEFLGQFHPDPVRASAGAESAQRGGGAKSPRSATRALKRHLAGHLWRLMLADETHTSRASSKVAANAS